MMRSMSRKMTMAGLMGTAALLLGAVGAAAAPPGTLLQAKLSRVAGENPSVSPDCPADAVARWDGSQVKVSLDNMDPVRFPAGTLCETEVRAGLLGARGLPLEAAPAKGCIPAVDVTGLDFLQSGTIAAGDIVEVRIRCRFNRERHETRWQGIFETL